MAEVTLRTIAEELNISIATVSWVLAGKGKERKISPATQEKILLHASSINYQPNMLARALNRGVSNTVGLILPSISDSFYSAIAKAIELSLDKIDCSLMICSSESETLRERRMIGMLKSHRVDGIIIAPTEVSKIEIRRLIDESYPLVLFDRFFTDIPASYVLIDNEESCYKLTEHLVRKGSRKIAFITTNPHLHNMDLRRKGYEKALKKHRMEINPSLIGEIGYHGYEKNLPSTLDRIFRATPDIDAFLFATHILAIEAFQYFREHRIDYNRKFRLACIHEESLFQNIAPHINVAMMPVVKIGRRIVDILAEQMKTKYSSSGMQLKKMENVNNKSVLPCKLIIRD
ncbi:MAG: LacI family transcriptional regulator [Tannerella sp.]|jgi:LacI family transcriptional regulator|nr:LacI family transcriptional regulator [Tannerella sp.]